VAIDHVLLDIRGWAAVYRYIQDHFGSIKFIAMACYHAFSVRKVNIAGSYFWIFLFLSLWLCNLPWHEFPHSNVVFISLEVGTCIAMMLFCPQNFKSLSLSVFCSPPQLKSILWMSKRVVVFLGALMRFEERL